MKLLMSIQTHSYLGMPKSLVMQKCMGKCPATHQYQVVRKYSVKWARMQKFLETQK